MTQDAPITDLDLLAYADGRLEPARARQVEAALADDPALRAKVDDFARQNAELAAQFDAYAQAPLPDRLATMLRTDPEPGRPDRRWATQAAAAAVVALAAGLGGWWLGSTTATDTATDAATDGVLATAAELHTAGPATERARDAAGRPSTAIRWFSEQVSLELAVPDLRDKGFALVDKRRVDFGGSKGVRLRYRAETGARFDVFLKSRWRRRGAPVSTTRRDGTALAHWLDGPLRVVVAGSSQRGPDVGTIARTLRARMRQNHAEDAPDLEPHGTDAPAQATATRSRDLEPASRPKSLLDMPATPNLLQPATDGGGR
jgi:anti-sigma factor RsiW